MTGPNPTTLCALLFDRARSHATAPAVSTWTATGWETLSWGHYRTAIAEAAAGLAELGIARGDRVAIVAGNRAEHLVADQAIVHAGAVPVTLYSSLSADQLVYCVNDAGAVAVVLEDRAHLSRWWPLRDRMPSLRTIVLMDAFTDVAPLDDDAVVRLPVRSDLTGDAELPVPWQALLAGGRTRLREDARWFDRSWRAVRGADTACMVYTSGTTGNPKGVVLTHASLLAEIRGLDVVPGLIPRPHTFVGYLPFAHVVERVFSLYLPMLTGGHVYLCPSPARLFEFLRRARPTLFFGVPRMWEKLTELARAHVRLTFDADGQEDFERAVEAGAAVQRAAEAGTDDPDALAVWAKLDPEVLAPVREALGLDACRSAIGGSAPTAPVVNYFAAGLGVPHHEGYGLSETSCVLAMNPPGALKVGTVGPALPGTEIRIADDGEVQVRGGIVCPGYWHLPEQTAALFTDDGWLRTGDLGSLDADGYLTVTGRAKELIVTSYGKNVSPVPIEAMVDEHPLVRQTVLVGEARPFVSALIVIDPAETARFRTEPAAHPTEDAGIHAALRAHLDQVNARLSNPERVKRFVVLDREWTAASGELTPSLKLRRSVIAERHASAIDQLYDTTA
ncbi:MAG: long-chain fatty acid--CoA ligase [Pseudonocardia sp.]